MQPQLSVIIPTYKRTHSLKKIIQYLQAQKNIQLEIIVVDQNPPGFFDELLLSVVNTVIHLTQDTPNASLARNNGFKRSTAPFILFIDDDLVPEIDFCRKGLDIFETHPLINCFVPLVYSREGEIHAFSDFKKKLIEYYPQDKSVFSITDAISAAVFFERSYFQLSGGFDIYLFEFAKSSEDMEFFLRMRQRKMGLWFVSFLKIFHDEKVEGGCELRTSEYWVSRKKNVRAYVFRNRIHNIYPGKISFSSTIQIWRSSVFNKKILSSGLKHINNEIKLLRDSIKESREFYLKYKDVYEKSSVTFVGGLPINNSINDR